MLHCPSTHLQHAALAGHARGQAVPPGVPLPALPSQRALLDLSTWGRAASGLGPAVGPAPVGAAPGRRRASALVRAHGAELSSAEQRRCLQGDDSTCLLQLRVRFNKSSQACGPTVHPPVSHRSSMCCDRQRSWASESGQRRKAWRPPWCAVMSTEMSMAAGGSRGAAGRSAGQGGDLGMESRQCSAMRGWQCVLAPPFQWAARLTLSLAVRGDRFTRPHEVRLTACLQRLPACQGVCVRALNVGSQAGRSTIPRDMAAVTAQQTPIPRTPSKQEPSPAARCGARPGAPPQSWARCRQSWHSAGSTASCACSCGRQAPQGSRGRRQALAAATGARRRQPARWRPARARHGAAQTCGTGGSGRRRRVPCRLEALQRWATGTCRNGGRRRRRAVAAGWGAAPLWRPCTITCSLTGAMQPSNGTPAGCQGRFGRRVGEWHALRARQR